MSREEQIKGLSLVVAILWFRLDAEKYEDLRGAIKGEEDKWFSVFQEGDFIRTFIEKYLFSQT